MYCLQYKITFNTVFMIRKMMMCITNIKIHHPVNWINNSRGLKNNLINLRNSINPFIDPEQQEQKITNKMNNFKINKAMIVNTGEFMLNLYLYITIFIIIGFQNNESYRNFKGSTQGLVS